MYLDSNLFPKALCKWTLLGKILCKYQQFYNFVKNPSQDSSYSSCTRVLWWLIGKGRQLDWNKGACDMLPSRWTPSSKYYLYAMFITFINSCLCLLLFLAWLLFFLHFLLSIDVSPKIWMCDLSPCLIIHDRGDNWGGSHGNRQGTKCLW